MSYVLPHLTTKNEIDDVIKNTGKKVLILRFGRDTDMPCQQMDEVLVKAAPVLRKVAEIYLIDINAVPIYTKYFDITIIPSTIFFYDGRHMKVDYGVTPDHTKFVGAFNSKQDCIDLIEVIVKGGVKGKYIVNSPIDPRYIPKYELIYKDI